MIIIARSNYNMVSYSLCIKYSRLLRCSTAMGSSTGLVTLGPLRYRACKSVLSIMKRWDSVYICYGSVKYKVFN